MDFILAPPNNKSILSTTRAELGNTKTACVLLPEGLNRPGF